MAATAGVPCILARRAETLVSGPFYCASARRTASLAWNVPVREMIEGYLYGWVANQLSAAVRLLPLGPTRAQLLQQQLLPLIADQAALLQGSHPRKLWSGAVGAGLAQLTHAELYSRLFRS